MEKKSKVSDKIAKDIENFDFQGFFRENKPKKMVQHFGCPNCGIRLFMDRYPKIVYNKCLNCGS